MEKQTPEKIIAKRFITFVIDENDIVWMPTSSKSKLNKAYEKCFNTPFDCVSSELTSMDFAKLLVMNADAIKKQKAEVK